MDSNKEQAKALIQKIYDTFNTDDLDKLDDLFHAEYLDYSAGVPVPTPFDLQTLKGILQMYTAAFPDGRWSISDVIIEGSGDGLKGAWRDHFTGTHQGELMGIPATGRTVDVYGISIGEIRDGKAYRHWSVLDNLGMMQQLGVIPTPGQ
ncbi:MAG: ester cyclase [Chloroflexota bacterium]|nr:ester cyclase [Chloroflexota bacterium]